MDDSEHKGRFRKGGPHGHHGRGRRRGRGRGGPLARFVEPCVLLLLCEGSAHGYDLRERLIDLDLVDAKLDMGNLYRTLRRMEEDGLVLSSWIKDNPGPQKRVYEVSEAGREALQFWAKGVEQRRNFLQKFLDLYEAQLGKEEQ